MSLSKKSVGIDIADRTIEVAELRGNNVFALGRVNLQPGVVDRGLVKDEKLLTESIKKVLSLAKPKAIEAKKVIFALPEAQVYTHVFSLKPHKSDERKGLIAKEARTSIPLPEEDLIYSQKVLHDDAFKTDILLVAASRKVVEEWRGFFKKNNIEVEAFDAEILATFRGLSDKKIKEPICLVDIGAVTTHIAIFGKSGLYYSHSLKIAGNNFTKDIADALKLKSEEAEAKKIEISFSDSGSRVFTILAKSLEKISKEAKTAIEYIQQNNNQVVKEVVLVGGSSQLKGLVEYFKTSLGLPVRLGKPALIKDANKLEYLVAVGLALKGGDKDSLSIVLPVKKQKKKKKKTAKNKSLRIDKVKDTEQTAKLRGQKIVLIIIVIFGIIALGAAYWYRSHTRAQQQAEINAKVEQAMPVDYQASGE